VAKVLTILIQANGDASAVPQFSYLTSIKAKIASVCSYNQLAKS